MGLGGTVLGIRPHYSLGGLLGDACRVGQDGCGDAQLAEGAQDRCGKEDSA